MTEKGSLTNRPLASGPILSRLHPPTFQGAHSNSFSSFSRRPCHLHANLLGADIQFGLIVIFFPNALSLKYTRATKEVLHHWITLHLFKSLTRHPHKIPHISQRGVLADLKYSEIMLLHCSEKKEISGEVILPSQIPRYHSYRSIIFYYFSKLKNVFLLLHVKYSSLTLTPG